VADARPGQALATIRQSADEWYIHGLPLAEEPTRTQEEYTLNPACQIRIDRASRRLKRQGM
jgi:hypothetical protein